LNFLNTGTKNLKPYQGLKLRNQREKDTQLAKGTKNLKPYQGLKLTTELHS